MTLEHSALSNPFCESTVCVQAILILCSNSGLHHYLYKLLYGEVITECLHCITIAKKLLIINSIKN